MSMMWMLVLFSRVQPRVLARLQKHLLCVKWPRFFGSSACGALGTWLITGAFVRSSRYIILNGNVQCSSCTTGADSRYNSAFSKEMFKPCNPFPLTIQPPLILKNPGPRNFEVSDPQLKANQKHDEGTRIVLVLIESRFRA